MFGDTTQLRLDGCQFWTPWEILGSLHVEDWLDRYFNQAYGRASVAAEGN